MAWLSLALLSGCPDGMGPLDAGADVSIGDDAFDAPRADDALLSDALDAAVALDAWAAPDAPLDDVPLDAWVLPDVPADAWVAPDVPLDAWVAPDVPLDAWVAPDVPLDAWVAPDVPLDAWVAPDVPTDAGIDGGIVDGVLVHDNRSEPLPLGGYRRFRGEVTPFQIDLFRIVLTVRSRVRIDMMGTARAPLTDAQIATGSALPASPFSWPVPSPAQWRVQTPSSVWVPGLCWASEVTAGCGSTDWDRLRYLRIAAASDGRWDAEATVEPGTYDLAIARGAPSGPSAYNTLYYYGDIEIEPM